MTVEGKIEWGDEADSVVGYHGSEPKAPEKYCGGAESLAKQGFELASVGHSGFLRSLNPEVFGQLDLVLHGGPLDDFQGLVVLIDDHVEPRGLDQPWKDGEQSYAWNG